MVIAGPTLFIATALVTSAGGRPWLVSVCLVVCQAVMVIAVLLVRVTRRTDEAALAGAAVLRGTP